MYHRKSHIKDELMQIANKLGLCCVGSWLTQDDQLLCGHSDTYSVDTAFESITTFV